MSFGQQASGWIGSEPGPSARAARPHGPALRALTSDDREVSLHVTGDDIPISYVSLHGLLDFAHPKLIASVPDPCGQDKLSQCTGRGNGGRCGGRDAPAQVPAASGKGTGLALDVFQTTGRRCTSLLGIPETSLVTNEWKFGTPQNVAMSLTGSRSLVTRARPLCWHRCGEEPPLLSSAALAQGGATHPCLH